MLCVVTLPQWQFALNASSNLSEVNPRLFSVLSAIPLLIWHVLIMALLKKKFDMFKKGTDSFICYKCKNVSSGGISQQSGVNSETNEKKVQSDGNTHSTLSTLSPAVTEAIRVAVVQW